MMIDKIGGPRPLDNVYNSQRIQGKDQYTPGHDSIAVSQEAKEMAEAYYLHSVAMETPDIREDRIAEVRAKIQDPNYINSVVIDSTADAIMTAFGL